MKRSLAPLFAALLLVASPAAAQFSDSYSFLKSVRDRDVLKAKSFLDKPGSTLVNARDADTGETALHITIKRKDLPWTSFLLQNGADPNARDKDGATALMQAAVSGYPEAVRLLLASKAQVDAVNGRGETALIIAVHNRDSASVRFLLDAGADPDRADNLAGLSARDYAARDQRNSSVGKMLAEAPKKLVKKSVGPTL